MQGQTVRLTAAALTLFLGITVAAVAVDYYEEPMEPINPRFSAMGGPHAAAYDGFSALFQNPAGYLQTEPEISFAELTLGLKGPVFSIADTFLAGASLEDISELLDGLYTGMDVAGPLAFGYVGHGLGFGMYSNTSSEIRANNPFTAKEKIMQDLLLSGGYSFPIIGGGEGYEPHKLDGGVLLKGGFRGTIKGDVSAIELQKPSMDLVLDRPFYFTSLIGADLGLLYSYEGRWHFGITAKDAFTPTKRSEYEDITAFRKGDPQIDDELGLVPFSLNVGGMYRVDLSSRNIFISEAKFFLDYEDVFDYWLYPEMATNPILHVGLGTEITMMSILDLRLGFAEGLPAAGIGLDLHFFTLNAAMFGTERSTEPGLSPVYNLQLGFQFTM